VATSTVVTRYAAPTAAVRLLKSTAATTRTLAGERCRATACADGKTPRSAARKPVPLKVATSPYRRYVAVRR
jgi:hypothetical protein